ncbi:MAG: hypothetical protein HYV63_00265 [Candidatus Schekmanbacteria bacterium]|nr:hypothetical protein [Candidatus Schekmanbacteria bacterium]
MSARRKDLSTSDLPAGRIQISAKIIAFPANNRAQIAREAWVSRPTVYALGRKGRHALEAALAPDATPPPLSADGFWLWVDCGALKRAIVALRAITGATHAMIVAFLIEVFALRISEETVRQVIREAYQRAFDYRQSVDLRQVERACLDEMYRWGRCELTGVDAASLFIFLAEKQPRCDTRQWAEVLARLDQRQGLDPGQVCSDGASAIAKAVGEVWPEARHSHDINHARRALDKVRHQADEIAYRAIARHDGAWERYQQGTSARMPRRKLDRLLADAWAAEKRAIAATEWLGAALARA